MNRTIMAESQPDKCRFDSWNLCSFLRPTVYMPCIGTVIDGSSVATSITWPCVSPSVSASRFHTALHGVRLCLGGGIHDRAALPTVQPELTNATGHSTSSRELRSRPLSAAANERGSHWNISRAAYASCENLPMASCHRSSVPTVSTR